jgi:hypothetical protein
VASRCPQRLPFTALISLSTSRSVRCSRERYSAFGFRRGTTVNFSLAGGLRASCTIWLAGLDPQKRTRHYGRSRMPI